MTSVVDGEAKKQKGAFNYDFYELKLDFPSELESFVKDVSKFGVVSVTEKHCCTSLVKEVVQCFLLCMKSQTVYLKTGQCLFRNFRY
jgi:hypothetical protein